MTIILILLIIIMIYENVLGAFGLLKLGDEILETNIGMSYGILIPCHNESSVIYDNLLAIYNNGYSRLKVFVLLDNCTDDTLDTVYKFKNDYTGIDIYPIEVCGGTKPKCIRLGVEYIKQHGLWDIDNVIILDADNKLSRNFIQVVNDLHSKYEIIQTRIKSSNSDGIVAMGFQVSFNMLGVTRQIARNNIGLSALLSGTGFSISREIFDSEGFLDCDTLTEDLEFGVNVISKGYYIRYTDKAFVLNENLTELIPSIKQRVRWCRGHVQVGVRMNGRLILNFLNRPSLQLFDILVMLNSPMRAIVFILIGVSSIDTFLIITITNIIITIYNLWITVYINDMNIKTILSRLHFSFFMGLCIIWGTITFKYNTWSKTKHLNLNDKKRE